jgi:hypothetical protein
MWLQEKRDPNKEWLQLSYSVTMQNIQMEVQEWPDKWKVLVITKNGSHSTDSGHRIE